jgi:hypothetical protein
MTECKEEGWQRFFILKVINIRNCKHFNREGRHKRITAAVRASGVEGILRRQNERRESQNVTDL